ncbi:Lrp/AsnC family transcriptional regulator [Streptomyces sp. NPDC059853]|uniref:Lrp/AsnC family transcriptional regulator n=1 Tax=Streptomyces sp. NPDC059853 TaxID=3346973 RepID=UPI00365FB049
MTHLPPAVDELDRTILALLIADARASFVDIGRRVGLSAPAVKRRVDRLRAHGVITGFTATVRAEALGWGMEAFVEVYCDSAAPPSRMSEVARNHPEIVAAMTVTGDADALLHIRARTIGHFERVLERIRAEPFVRRTDSRVVLTQLLPGGESGSGAPLRPLLDQPAENAVEPG